METKRQQIIISYVNISSLMTDSNVQQ